MFKDNEGSELAGVQSLLSEVFPTSSGRKVEKVGRDIFIKNFEFQVKELDIMKTVKEGNNSVMKIVCFSKSDLIGGW